MKKYLRIIPNDKKLYLFDFCGTIFNCNTTMEYLAFIANKSGLIVKLRFLFYGLIAKIIKTIGLIDKTAHVRLRVKTLKGISKDKLSEFSVEFIEWLLLKHKNVRVYDQLVKLRESGKNVQLVTATLEGVAKKFAEREKIEIALSSTLEFREDGVCTGKYKFQVYPHTKAQHIISKFNQKALQDAVFITDDSYADDDLLGLVGYPVLIIEESK
ncbi:MAG: HAD-IB family phosphatase [Desulfamplus sp.]|nr:HAD-IB family phosphatase [Desulfamplus sp.]